MTLRLLVNFSGAFLCIIRSITVIYLKGWQMAMYRSHVNDVIVKIVALVDVSDSSPCSTQMVSSNGYELGSQMFIKSNGIPLRRHGKMR